MLMPMMMTMGVKDFTKPSTHTFFLSYIIILDDDFYGTIQAKGKVSCATCEGTAHIRCYIQVSYLITIQTLR